MRAIVAHELGDPTVLRLVDLPVPEPESQQLRIAVHVAGVSWMDTQIRKGIAPAVFASAPPYVPGGAVAGYVTAVGSATDRGWIGSRIVAQAGGGYAEDAIAAAEHTWLVPDGLELTAAMALMNDGATALALLERTPVGDGDVVLVVPGVGGLSNLLVQLCLSAGATVVAAARGADKRAAAAALGAAAVDYSATDWLDRVRATLDGRGVDAVFDGVGGRIGSAASDLVVDGGRFSGYGMASGTEALVRDAVDRRLTVTDMSQLPGFWPDTARRVRHVLQEAAAGRLRPLIGRVYPLAAAADAHTDIEARRFIGKILLAVR